MLKNKGVMWTRLVSSTLYFSVIWVHDPYNLIQESIYIEKNMDKETKFYRVKIYKNGSNKQIVSMKREYVNGRPIPVLK